MRKVRLKLREAIEAYQAQFPPDERPNHIKIAADINISPSTMSRYTNNKVQQTDLVVIAKLCDYLGIRDFNEILEFVDEDQDEEAN